MSWTAADFALIITTSATAITSIVSVAWPVVNKFINDKSTKKEKINDQFFESLIYCVENVEKVIYAVHRQGMRAAYIRARKISGAQGQEEDENLLMTFKTHARKIELYGKKYGVETIFFVAVVSEIIASGDQYELLDGKLVLSGGEQKSDENAANNLRLMRELLEHANKIINSADKIKL